MKTIGLVGGVASGKSLVGRILVELGAGLLDADRTGHAVLADDAEVREALHKRWGDSILTADGSIDRSAVAKRVFAETEAGAADRKFLERLLHPRIRRRIMRERDHFAADGKPAVVLDAPLLLESGWDPLCDLILFVEVPRHIRLERAQTRGWTEAEFARREAAQWPVDKKRAAANVVIANSGSEINLRAAIEDFWQHYVANR